jgi:hypothetical protein
VAKQTLLHRVGRRYYLRRRVPLDLIRLIKINLDLWKSLISPSGSRENDWRLLVDTKGEPKETIKISLGTADKQRVVEALHQKAAEVSAIDSV